MYTIVSITQVIWAKISEEKLVLRIVGEPEPIEISKEDGLFNFYKGQFDKTKSEMASGLKILK